LRVVRYEAHDSDFRVELPLDPMHGTVGVAPALGEVRSSLTPGDWGGNMDTPEMRAGVTCYLGVNVPGALFSFGDGHARQGEGESCGVAVEAAMETVAVIDLIKGSHTPWPRLESDQHLMTTGSARPLEDAFRIAHAQMVWWVAELTGLSVMDSYQLVAQSALTPIANVVDTNYTVVAKVAKSLLAGATVMEDMHRRLRSMGSAYLVSRTG
jgi:amidase